MLKFKALLLLSLSFCCLFADDNPLVPFKKMLSIIFLLPSPIFHLLAVFMSLLPIKFLPLLSLS